MATPPTAMDRLFSGGPESERLIADASKPMERTAICNTTRFSFATLFGLVLLLTGTIFVLLTNPITTSPCDSTPVHPTPKDAFIVGLVTDIHLDLTPSTCDNYDKYASMYGVFGCDSTLYLVDRTLEDMATTLRNTSSNPTVVLFLGDAAKHQHADTWGADITLNLIETTFQLAEQRLPDTPMIPTVGNNDLPAYYDIWAVDYAKDHAEGWYEALARVYVPAITRGSRVELSPDFAESFAAGGYYSVTVSGEDLLIVSLNTNIFASNVVDVMNQGVLAAKQLEWLEATLRNTSSDLRFVVIGHHPPGLSLYSLYSKQAAKANWRLSYFESFRSICKSAAGDRIVGMFFGHEHQDSYALEADHGGRNFNIFSIPSVSPVYSGQPSYCIAAFSASDKTLVDLTTYHTWLDFYTREKSAPQFFSYNTLRDILKVKELSFKGIQNATTSLIEESDGMRICSALKTRLYQGRYVPTLPAHLHYCYTSSLRVASFIQCIERYGYDGKKFILNA